MILLVLAAALAAAEPSDGVEGLCAQVARIASSLPSTPTAVQVIAEGAAIDLATAVSGRCATQLGSTSSLATADRIVRIRLRVAGAALAALVDVTDKGRPDAPGSVLLTQSVEVPAGATLERWLSAAGSGIETWLAGSVDGDVFALCGVDSDGDGTAEVALITPTTLQLMRWTSEGLDVITRVEVPANLRPRARAPAASAACQTLDGAFVVAFGFHDRGKGAILRVSKGVAQPLIPIDGIPIGLNASGQPIIAEGVAGTGLIRWKGETMAAAVATPDGKGMHVLGVTQAGALWANETHGRAFVAGEAVAVADLEARGSPQLILTRPVFRGSGAEDRLVVTALDDSAVVRHQSQTIHGVLSAAGVVTIGSWQRVLAVQSSGGRSQLYALGHRQPATAPR